MKYCVKCGAEMVDDAVMCVKCGTLVSGFTLNKNMSQDNCQTQTMNGAKIAVFIFMLIGTVANALYTLGLSLAWCIPMTVVYYKNAKNNKEVGIGLKICTLIFVNTIAGIIMLCEPAANNK